MRPRKRPRISQDEENTFKVFVRHNCNLILELFPPSSVLALAATSRYFFSVLSPLINRLYWFSDLSKSWQDIKIYTKVLKKRRASMRILKKLVFQPWSFYSPCRVITLAGNNFITSSQRVTHIKFVGHTLNPTKQTEYPDTLEYIEGDEFNLTLQNLPSTIATVIFDTFEEQIMGLEFPAKITQLYLLGSVNQPLTLPASLTHITFGDDFNQPLNNLPASLTHLTLGRYFNQPLDGIPSTLIYLSIGLYFNHPIDNLPQTLTTLIFSSLRSKSEYSITTLPASLVTLMLPLIWQHPVKCFIPPQPPPNLKLLKIGHPVSEWMSHLRTSKITDLEAKVYKGKIESSQLPQSLTRLTIWGETYICNQDNLPPTLTHLTQREGLIPLHPFPSAWPKTITHLSTFLICDKWPPALVRLTLSSSFNSPLIDLPATITHLGFWDGDGKLFSERSQFNQALTALPHNLLHLSLGAKYSHPVDNLPLNLTHLTFGDSFNHNVDSLPEGLTHLAFGNHFTTPITKLPSTLTHLFLGSSYNSPLECIPNSVVLLGLGHMFGSSIHLPSKLCKFYIESAYKSKNLTLIMLAKQAFDMKIMVRVYTYYPDISSLAVPNPWWDPIESEINFSVIGAIANESM